uniref:Uncharacterized protein n=1 Tax=CrAss-like virus sp. ctYsL76 TaxID=2826826 RepID=A0A8S5QMM7_9CAUD|nr:MAG TPA: hypothetical protein [CrAss-like virus sp. ctYsL76]
MRIIDTLTDNKLLNIYCNHCSSYQTLLLSLKLFISRFCIFIYTYRSDYIFNLIL